MLIASVLAFALAADDPKPAEAAPATAPAPTTETTTPADPSSAKVVAILDLKVGGDAAPLANALASVVASGVSSRPGCKAVSRNELKSLLAHQADASMLGCDSMNCLANVAKLADANLVVSGSLDKITGGDAGPGGTAYALALSLIDPSVPSIVSRATSTWRGNPEEMVTVIPPMLDRLFDGAAAASYQGSLEIFAPEGATVALDGKDLGAAPLKGALHDLPIGVHTIALAGDAWVPKNVDVVVGKNETTTTHVSLDEVPFYSRWWFWTAVGGGGAVVVGGATTVGVILALGNKPPPATTLVIKSTLPTATR
jgi:hypothetical protein